MVYIYPWHWTYSKEDVVSPVMIVLPCYNKRGTEPCKTIKSMPNTTHLGKSTVLFIVMGVWSSDPGIGYRSTGATHPHNLS